MEEENRHRQLNPNLYETEKIDSTPPQPHELRISKNRPLRQIITKSLEAIKNLNKVLLSASTKESQHLYTALIAIKTKHPKIHTHIYHKVVDIKILMKPKDIISHSTTQPQPQPNNFLPFKP